MPRTAATLLCWVLLATAFTVTGAPPVSACSCVPPLPPAEAIDQAQWVFVAHQVGSEIDDSAEYQTVHLQMEVTTVYKGDVPADLDLHTEMGSCAVDFSGHGALAFTITPFPDGTAHVSSCSGIYLPDEIRWLYEPLPAGGAHGDPGFVVGTDVSPARIALLDEQARLIGYGFGEGRLVDAAVCPGADKIVEVVRPDDEWATGDAARPFIEVRDVASLDVERRFDIEITPDEVNQLRGDWVIDMQCHDPDGDLVTYLLPMSRWDSPALVHVWRNGELTIADLEGARAITVDPERELAYTIVGADGMDVEIRELSGQLVDTMPVPLGHQAWKLALSPDRDQLVLLTTDDPRSSEHWFYAEVNSMLVMDIDSGAVSVFPLRDTGNAYVFAPRADGFTTVTFHLDSLSMTVSSLSDGQIEVVGEYPVVLSRGPVAVGSSTVLLVDTDRSDAQAVLALDLSSGGHVAIVDLVRSGVAVAFPGSVPSAQPLPVTTTTTMPPPTTSDDATVTTTSPPTTATASATTVPPGSSSAPALIIFGVATLLLIVAIVAIALTRRSRDG